MTFSEIKRIEPKLEQIERDIRAVRKSPTFCANETWYRQFKPRVVALVGFDAKNERLTNSDAYDVAYQSLYAMLPNCSRNCGCM